MNSPHLDESSKKYICPQCHQKTFVVYLKDGNIISDIVGRCDRIKNCQYHYRPHEFFRNEPYKQFTNNWSQPIKKPTVKKGKASVTPDYYLSTIQYLYQIGIDYKQYNGNDFAPIDEDKVKNTFNNFAYGIYKIFGRKGIQALIKYKVGNSVKYSNGANIFWYFDHENICRYGRVLNYSNTINRTPLTNNINMDSALRIYQYQNNINSDSYSKYIPFFGAHLLNDNDKDVRIVESEKTAIICSIMYPEFIWLATGGNNMLAVNDIDKRNFKWQPLENRRIILDPDLDSYIDWEHKFLDKVNNYYEFKEVHISQITMHFAKHLPDKKGCDLADIILFAINK